MAASQPGSDDGGQTAHRKISSDTAASSESDQQEDNLLLGAKRQGRIGDATTTTKTRATTFSRAVAPDEDTTEGLRELRLGDGDGDGDGGDTEDGAAAARAWARADGSRVDAEMMNSAAVTYKVYKRRWFGLVQLMLLNIIVSWDWFTFAPVAGNSAAYFSTDESAINWLSTGFLFAFCVMTPLTIYVLHLGPKLSIVSAATLLLVGNWVRYAGAHSRDGGSFGVVMFGQVLIGFGQPFVLAAPTRYSDLWFTNRGRVAATALTSLANPFGGALGQLITPFWVNVPGDVSNAVLYTAIISTVACLPSFFIPAAPPTPVAPSSETPKLGLQASVRALLGQAEFWLILVAFSVYVGFFNAITSVLNQVLSPYGYNDTQSGIAGALLIVVGLVASAVTSPIIDRTKSFLLTIKIAVPVIGLCYLVFIWMPQTDGLAGPFVVLCVLGAASFSLVPVAVEYLVELTHPVSPEVTSTLAWSGGQLLGGVFILAMNALKAPAAANPPYNMTNALVFEAVVALAVVPLPLCLGLFGRADKVRLRRIRSDQADGADGAGTREHVALA